MYPDYVDVIFEVKPDRIELYRDIYVYDSPDISGAVRFDFETVSEEYGKKEKLEELSAFLATCTVAQVIHGER